jgi:hypothetical protein
MSTEAKVTPNALSDVKIDFKERLIDAKDAFFTGDGIKTDQPNSQDQVQSVIINEELLADKLVERLFEKLSLQIGNLVID